MKRNLTFLGIGLLAAALGLAACGSGTEDARDTLTEPAVPEETVAAPPEVTPEALSGLFEGGTVPDTPFGIRAAAGGRVTENGGVYTLTSEGEYTLTGRLENGQIVVDAGEGKVKLILAGASVTVDGAAILVKSADKLNLEVQEGTYNVITDTRETPLSTEDGEENYDAAVWASSDLDLQGGGVLVVKSAANNGVKTKDDLKVEGIDLFVTAYDNALKGNDSVTVESGRLLLVSEAADGIKTSNTDVSKKGNQRGTVRILGGTVEIRSARDGIQAAYDAEILNDACVTVYTADRAFGEQTETVKKLYLIISTAQYSASREYYACFYPEAGGDETVLKAEYETMVSGGRRASYYGLAVEVPAGCDYVRFVSLPAGETPKTADGEALSKIERLNDAMNGYLVTSQEDSGCLGGDWVLLEKNSGNSAKTTYSSKGIKAENEIRILGGTVSVFAMDDGLHANGGEPLENGASGLGNVTVSGGLLAIDCADDGIHADGKLTVRGGIVNVKEAHEGLEANEVRIEGGSTFVYAKDDCVNATVGRSTPLISVSGGFLSVTTPLGDTDGIDSNGNYRQSGGLVIVRSGSVQGRMAGSVDVDGTVEVSGGTILAFGGICELPSNGVNVYVSSGTRFEAGHYELKGAGKTEVSLDLTETYTSLWIGGEALRTGVAYELVKDGTSVLQWTQEEGTTGNASLPGGGFRPGK